MLVHIRSLLSGDAYTQCKTLLEHAQWGENAGLSAEHSRNMQSSEKISEGTAEIAQLRSLIVGQLQRNALFFSAALPKRIYPPVFNRDSGEVSVHGSRVDMAIRLLPGTMEQMRADVSCTVFLSEPESYEGGELIIEDTHGQHTIKLAAGDAVVYSASHMHRVLPILAGRRVTCTLWAESMVREEAHRHVLYDMDIAILNLRQTIGDTEAVIRLSACYHNLLRLWAVP